MWAGEGFFGFIFWSPIVVCEFSLVVANGAYPLVVVCGLLIVVASLIAERGL